jgi:hypothetical protein
MRNTIMSMLDTGLTNNASQMAAMTPDRPAQVTTAE